MLIAVAAGGCGQKNTFVPPPPPKVTVALPVVQSVVDWIEFTGTTKPMATVELRSRVGGYLQRIAFEDGADVKEGDLLFVIEQEPFQVALETAQANLAKAQAALELARANLVRSKQLVGEDALSQQQLDVDQAELATAEANVKSAQSAIRQAELNLHYTEIRAPLSGRIGRHLVDIGNLVDVGQTLMAVIETIDPIYGYFYLSEQELLRFMQMQQDWQSPAPNEPPPTLYLGLENETDFPRQGHLDFRELGLDPGTGTALRRGIFPNPDRTLIPGLFVRIRAAIGQPQPRLLVEERAIGTDQRGEFLLVVNAKQEVEYRPVKLGFRVGNLRVVREGVQEGERIIVNGLQRARPGSQVNAELASAAPPPAGSPPEGTPPAAKPLPPVAESQAPAAEPQPPAAESPPPVPTEAEREPHQPPPSGAGSQPDAEPQPAKVSPPKTAE